MKEKTIEQQARELLDRMGVEGAHDFTSGDLLELGNILNDKNTREKEKKQKEILPTCQCGAYCWAYDENENVSPCRGEIDVSEEYPGCYIHYCEAHGNPFDE